MAKISQISCKYIVHATIEIEGVVDRPDVVGAIFGQIEGLLGQDLELRELQRSGRIGRIEVDVASKDGKTEGRIVIPSSLDKTETAIIASALEIIERIGPCNAKIAVTKIEDERAAKRDQIIGRAKELLKNLQDSVLPDSNELSSEVSDAIKMMGIQNFGKDSLPAGPNIAEDEEIICVEGRADVINLLKHGFKNVIAINGTSVPETIKELSKQKEVTVFVDGDRGGDLIIKEMLATCNVDFVTKAPDGKEVEELQKKEIHQSLRGKVASADWSPKSSQRRTRKSPARKKTERKSSGRKSSSRSDRSERSNTRGSSRTPRGYRMTADEKVLFSGLYDELAGTGQAYMLDKKNNVLGKVQMTELAHSIEHLPEVAVVVADQEITAPIANACDDQRLKCVVAPKAAKMRTPLVSEKELA